MSSEKSNSEAYTYIRKKINQLLEVMGTFPLKPEELDDKTLLELDPIGILAESFRQVLQHHEKTNNELEFTKNEIRSIFDSINSSILVIDQDRCIKDFNPQAKSNFFPKKTNDEIYNQPLDKVCGFSKTFLEQLYLNPSESHHLINNGRNFVANINMIGIEGSKQQLSIVNFYDITEQKKIEDELNQHRNNLETLVDERTKDYKKARDEAEKANTAKSDFLSSMSHELRTPMNAILGFGQVLEMDENLNEMQHASVEEILHAGHHLLELINEVLDLAKIEAGEMDMHIEKISILDILKKSLPLIRTYIDKRQLNLIDNVSDKGYIVMADFTRLKQVLLNLLSNAGKYNTDKGNIIISGEIINKYRLRISVTDSGEGISKEDIAKLFKPFVRLKNINFVEGAGIGLLISKQLIELMGGSIGVNSIPGEGSTFWIEVELSPES